MVEIRSGHLIVDSFAVGAEEKMPIEHRLDTPPDHILGVFGEIPPGNYIYRSKLMIRLDRIEHVAQSATKLCCYIVSSIGVKFVLDCTFDEYLEIFDNYHKEN